MQVPWGAGDPADGQRRPALVTSSAARRSLPAPISMVRRRAARHAFGGDRVGRRAKFFRVAEQGAPA